MHEYMIAPLLISAQQAATLSDTRCNANSQHSAFCFRTRHMAPRWLLTVVKVCVGLVVAPVALALAVATVISGLGPLVQAVCSRRDRALLARTRSGLLGTGVLRLVRAPGGYDLVGGRTPASGLWVHRGARTHSWLSLYVPVGDDACVCLYTSESEPRSASGTFTGTGTGSDHADATLRYT
jgi:hypothetical protein